MNKFFQIAKIMVMSMLIIFTSGCSFGSDKTSETTSGKTVEEMMGTDKLQEVYINGIPYVLNQNVSTYLFMGVDKSREVSQELSVNSGGQADVFFLVVINDEDKTYSILQLNRDTMTDVQALAVNGSVLNTYTAQLALSHFYGDGREKSCENTVWSVSNFLYGIEIDGYVALQMDAIPILNDWVGGVTVTIEDDFSAVDPSLKMGETITLNGQQAYNFIRFRKDVGDQTNISRMKRHQEYLSGLSSQMKTKLQEDMTLIADLYSQLQPYMVTDMGSGTVTKIAEKCKDYTNAGLFTIEGEAIEGEKFMEFYADEDSVKEVVTKLFYVESKTAQGESN